MPRAPAPVTPETEAFLKSLPPPMSQEEQSAEMRRKMLSYALRSSGAPEDQLKAMNDAVSFENHDVEGIQLRCFRAKSESGQQAERLLYYIHGGGWTAGCVDDFHELGLYLCSMAGPSLVVVLVEYPLAPEKKFPAGLDGCLSGLRWCVSNKEKLGLAANSKLYIGGDSAGGNLSSIVVHEVQDEIQFDGAILVYPATDLTMQTGESCDVYANGYLLAKDQIKWYLDQYVPEDVDRSIPQLSSINYTDHSKHPRTLLVLAECDPLFDEGVVYGEKVRSQGVEVTQNVYKGVVHAFFSMPKLFPEALQAYKDVVAFLLE